MNKEIASSFEIKFKKINDIRNEIIEELRTRLNELGEQNSIYDDEIDKIKTDEEGVIMFHDYDFDKWYPLTYLDDQAIYSVISEIDWK